MPTYEHKCNACGHEWEETYSIKDSVPTVCPECKVEGKVQRLISMPAGVKVELEGRELVQKLWKEGKDLARKARKDDNLAANLYGTKS
jgi:putative FmdB family regulatory protein